MKRVIFLREILRVATAAILAVSLPSIANATLFGFVYSSTDGSGINAFGTLDATQLNPGGPYLVTGMTGQRNAQAMTLSAPNGPLFNDNLIFTSGLAATFGGVAFTAGATTYDFFGDSTGICLGTVGMEETTDPFCAAAATHPIALILAPATLFGFSYSSTDGSGISAAGTLVTVRTGPNAYQVVRIDGERNGEAMALTAPNGPLFNDNLIFASGLTADFGGVAFIAGGTTYDFFGDSSGVCLGTVGMEETTDPFCAAVATHPIAFSLSPIAAPEPASLGLLGAGLAALGFIRRRRR